MQTLCCYTRLPLLAAPEIFPSVSVPSIHPIFMLPKQQLLALISKEPDIYSLPEQKASLLTLALANTNSFISWEGIKEGYYASPSPIITWECLEKLVLISGRRVPASMQFPTLALTCPADTLEGLPALLDEVLTTLSTVRREEEDFATSLLSRIELLSKAIEADPAKQRLLASTTATWAMTVTAPNFRKEHVSREVQDFWKQLLLANPADAVIQNATPGDIAELEDFLAAYLPLGNTASFHIFQKIKILKEVRGNLGDYLGGSSAAMLGMKRDGDSATHVEGNWKPTTPMPKASHFSNHQDWVAALKKWNEAARQAAEPETTDIIPPMFSLD